MLLLLLDAMRQPIVVLHVRDSLNLGHECPVGGGRCFQRLALADAVLNAHQAGEELFRRILFDVSVVYAYKGRDGARGSPPRLGHDGRRRSDDMNTIQVLSEAPEVQRPRINLRDLRHRMKSDLALQVFVISVRVRRRTPCL
eukprot:jgi/Tetstr1/453867/TSEL_040789.t1